ncbi:MAG: NUDIX domain-containing protein [bacterium]|nr:NUDIX domain-containing protein [bacterium]
MYTFFINDKPLLLALAKDNSPQFLHIPSIDYTSDTKLMDFVRQVEDIGSHGIQLICANPTEVMQELKSHFTVIHAGGGIVYNEVGQLLMMKRLGKWDLPKGKIDPGETVEEGALREVEEECGINKLKIRSFFQNSYHTYKLQGHRFLKLTHWYLMDSTFEGVLVPQLEESITEVKWINLAEVNLETLDTYESIRSILKVVKG